MNAEPVNAARKYSEVAKLLAGLRSDETIVFRKVSRGVQYVVCNARKKSSRIVQFDQCLADSLRKSLESVRAP